MATSRSRKVYLSILAVGIIIYSYGSITTRSKQHSSPIKGVEANLLVLTVATKETNNFKRFRRSAEINGLPLKVLGMGDKWRGLGEAKVSRLGRELKKYKDDPRQIILFADAYDVLLNGRADQLLDKFHKFDAKIVFSAEKNCYPQELASKYPPAYGIQYLNSGLFMGYAAEMYRMVTHSAFPSDGNDQKYYTEIYVDETLRRELGIKLDHRAEIFQSLFLAMGDIEIRYQSDGPYVYNKIYDTVPLVVHTNGPLKPLIDTLGNYIPKVWNPVDGCITCLENTKNLSAVQTVNYPLIVMGVYIDNATSCLTQFLQKILAQSYPKEKIHLIINNAIHSDVPTVEETVSSRSKEYASFRYCSQPNLIANFFGSVACREMALEECAKRKCDYYFHVDSTAHLDNPQTLRLLVEQNRPVVAPLLKQTNEDKWNFRGSWSSRWDREYGFYPPHMDFVKNNRRGLWIVPLITNCYLIRGDVIQNPETRPSYNTNKYKRHVKADVAFSLSMHKKDVDLMVSNRESFGHLLC